MTGLALSWSFTSRCSTAPGRHCTRSSMSSLDRKIWSFLSTLPIATVCVRTNLRLFPHNQSHAQTHKRRTRTVERVPVVELLLGRVGRAVVVHLHDLGEVERDDLGREDAVAEVARDTLLRPRERNLVDPRVQPLQRLVVQRQVHLSICKSPVLIAWLLCYMLGLTRLVLALSDKSTKQGRCGTRKDANSYEGGAEPSLY